MDIRTKDNIIITLNLENATWESILEFKEAFIKTWPQAKTIFDLDISDVDKLLAMQQIHHFNPLPSETLEANEALRISDEKHNEAVKNNPIKTVAGMNNVDVNATLGFEIPTDVLINNVEAFEECFPRTKPELGRLARQTNAAECPTCAKNANIRKMWKLIHREIKLMVSFDTTSIQDLVSERTLLSMTGEIILTEPKKQRMGCVACMKKHISQAIILMKECLQGYQHQEHGWLAIGHLAEASDEIVSVDDKLANKIRDIRINIVNQESTGLITIIPEHVSKLEKLFKENVSMQTKSFQNKVIWMPFDTKMIDEKKSQIKLLEEMGYTIRETTNHQLLKGQVVIVFGDVNWSIIRANKPSKLIFFPAGKLNDESIQADKDGLIQIIGVADNRTETIIVSQVKNATIFDGYFPYIDLLEKETYTKDILAFTGDKIDVRTIYAPRGITEGTLKDANIVLMLNSEPQTRQMLEFMMMGKLVITNCWKLPHTIAIQDKTEASFRIGKLLEEGFKDTLRDAREFAINNSKNIPKLKKIWGSMLSK